MPAAFREPSFWCTAAARSCTRRCRALPMSNATSRSRTTPFSALFPRTKPITSVAFMMLVEEGRVALDEPVHKYIPEWKDLGVFQAGVAPAFLTKPPSRPMLIVDLLRYPFVL